MEREGRIEIWPDTVDPVTAAPPMNFSVPSVPLWFIFLASTGGTGLEFPSDLK